MEKDVQEYLPYFLNEGHEYSVLGFFKHHNFTKKSLAHFALNKCLEYMSLSTDPELKSKAIEVKETLQDFKCKQDINNYWKSKNREKKKKTIETKIEIAEKKSKLCDAEQHVIVKRLVYKQDNDVRENFNAEIIKKREYNQDIEREQPISKSCKRKLKNSLEKTENNKIRLLGYQSENSELEDDEMMKIS
ncbi:3419_t:CDS:2 [Diversispora eburnea]|uniref:3419_t:CDS:1 n=1 Tax=Diversispora eburnea TaxID=1213867 RepID=A0A9N9DBS3_9GLOM|nr:3419_t:CDS:2 [Diversispora eburnea]